MGTKGENAAMIGIMNVGIASGTLGGYENVKFHKKNFYPEQPLFNYEDALLPKSFWEDLNSLYFALKRNQVSVFTSFFERWGMLSADKLAQSNIPIEEGDFGGRTNALHWTELKIALEWFHHLVRLWENTRLDKLGYSRKVLGEHMSEEPWDTAIPHNGFQPLLSVFDPPFIDIGGKNVYSLPEDEDALRNIVFTFVSKEIYSALQNVPIRPHTDNKYSTPIWAFQPRDWMDAALASFFIERIAANKRCKCGCGLPATGRSAYYNKTHQERAKKIRQRTKNYDACPTCQQPLKTERSRRRIGQLKKNSSLPT